MQIGGHLGRIKFSGETLTKLTTPYELLIYRCIHRDEDLDLENAKIELGCDQKTLDTLQGLQNFVPKLISWNDEQDP